MERETRSVEDSAPWQLGFGARPQPDGATRFRVWAPRVESLAVKIVSGGPRVVEMERGAEDVFEAVVPGVGAGDDYFYLLNGDRERPDPVSRWQPHGVHGPSRVLDPESFVWTDESWRGLPLKEYIVYELHTGTFTPEGTFAAAISRLAHLKELGVTAVELMPVAEFPGGRNWGYDGAHLYAPQSTYGGPAGLKRLIDACHGEGLAVILDVVYNHFGPEGNYFGEYAPIYSDDYRTPWGAALNFDGPESDGVRRFFVENALYWQTEYHVDALRLDAIHRIIDISPRHVLVEIGEAFRREGVRRGRQVWTIAESDLNDPRVISESGYHLDAQWSDDFHHSLHALLTGTERGYFADFGRLADLAKAISAGFVYDGQRSRYRRKRHGVSSVEQPGEQFVICLQNHDQVANSYWGERLGTLITPERQKLAAAILLVAPNVPMLFMGQEWGETAPFFYFTSHTDPALAEAVRRGRREEYSSFVREEEGAEEVGSYADPQSPATFARSRLDWARLQSSPHAELLRFYRDLLALRKRLPCLANCDKGRTRVEFSEDEGWLTIGRGDESGAEAVLVCNLTGERRAVPGAGAAAEGGYRLALWSADPLYGQATREDAPPFEIEIPGATVTLAGGEAALYERIRNQEN